MKRSGEDKPNHKAKRRGNERRKSNAREERESEGLQDLRIVWLLTYETTWRCRKNPFIGALGIQEPVIPGEPLFKG